MAQVRDALARGKAGWTRRERTFEFAEGMAGTFAEPVCGEPRKLGLSNVVVWKSVEHRDGR
ncbi:hypothetical protein QF002_004639 [Paraburkholderia youngii]